MNVMNKWKLDLTTGGARIATRGVDQSMNPPGYNPSYVATQQVDQSGRNDQQQQHLLNKKAWDMALGPVKSLPMNMLMMYMAGNTISIFPIMMVAMMALMSVNAAFKPLESDNGNSLIVHKLIFLLGNLGAIALAVYKVHTMGLLPNHASDWLDFVPPSERLQYVLSPDIYV